MDRVVALKGGAGRIFGYAAPYSRMAVGIEDRTGRVRILKGSIPPMRFATERCGSTIIWDYYAATDISRSCYSDKWAGLKSICMGLQTTVLKSGETAYSIRQFSSSSDDMEEIARSIKLHWCVIVLR
ncbi:MAG: hypothetical protein LBU32_19990 [Clostridiales bacterium]|nr:hypothetical protein [Clostridiales bacterium]